MISTSLYTSSTPEWPTPQAFFNELNSEFHFTLDVCATRENAKVRRHFTEQEDGLSQSWDKEVIWMNPPYGRTVGQWVKKASQARGGTVVCLLPARTDTKWFHDYIYGKAEVRFVKGRLKFGDATNSAPFPSLIAIFKSQTMH